MKLNRVAIEGNLCKDAEIIKTNGGKELQRFTIGVNDDYKPSGVNDWVKRSYFVSCYCTLKIYEGLKKGVRVNIDGKLITKDYEKDGVKRTYTSIEVYQLSIVNTSKSLRNNKETEVDGNRKEEDDDVDVPF